MEYYINAIRDAAAKCEPRELKPVLDFYVGQAEADYRGGALDVLEYYNIVNEYADTLRVKNVINYI